MWQGQRAARTSGSTRWSAGRRREYGFEPTRFDEMRRGAWDVHARVADMDIDGVARVAVLPVVPARLRRPAAHAVARRRRARARRDARVQRLAPRRVVRRASRPLHPEPDRVPARSRDRGRRDPAQRGARLQGGHVLGGARQARPADDPLRLLGSAVRGVRGDRDRAVPARRLVGHVADDLAPTRRPRSPRCCSARTACTARSTGSTRRSRCASPTSGSASRKAASVGSPGIIDRLDHCYKYQLGYLPTWRDVERAAERGAAPQLLVLRARRRLGHGAAPSHRRRAHPRRVRLPARRLVVAGHAGDARPPAARPGRPRRRGASASPGATRRSCSGTSFRERHGGDRTRSRASSPATRARRPDGSRSSRPRRARR